MALTDKYIRALKPADKEYVESDGRGLYIVVTRDGRKYFRARLKIDGKTSYQTFAPDFPELSLTAAREAFATCHRQCNSDPLAPK